MLRLLWADWIDVSQREGTMKHLQFPPPGSVELPTRLIYSYSSHVLLVCENCLLHVKTGRYCLLRMCVINRCQFFFHQNENTEFCGHQFHTLCTVLPKLWFPNHGCTRNTRMQVLCCSWLWTRHLNRPTSCWFVMVLLALNELRSKILHQFKLSDIDF